MGEGEEVEAVGITMTAIAVIMTANDRVMMEQIESIEMIEVIMTGMTVIGIAMNEEAAIQEEEDGVRGTVDAIDDERGISSRHSLSMWIRKKRTRRRRQKLEIPMRAHRGTEDAEIEAERIRIRMQIITEALNIGKSNFKMSHTLRSTEQGIGTRKEKEEEEVVVVVLLR